MHYRKVVTWRKKYTDSVSPQIDFYKWTGRTLDEIALNITIISKIVHQYHEKIWDN